RLRGGVVGPGERERAPALVDRDLADDVRGGAEAVQPDALGVAAHPQRAVADQARAEERRGLEIAVALGQREAVARVGGDPRGVAAVDVEAREPGADAEVLAPARAVAARPVRPPEPGDPDARARLDLGAVA